MAVRPVPVRAVVGFVLVVLGTAGCGTDDAARQVDATGTYEMDVPADWRPGDEDVVGEEVDVWFVAPGGGQGGPNVSVVAEATDLELDEYVTRSIDDGDESIVGFALMARGSRPVDGGGTAEVLEYTATDADGVQARFRSHVVAGDDVVVTALFTALAEDFDALVPDVEPVLETLRPA